MLRILLSRFVTQPHHNVQYSLTLVEPLQISPLLASTKSIEPTRKQQFTFPERNLTDAEAGHLAMQLQHIFHIPVTATDVQQTASTLRTIESAMIGRVAGRVHDHILNYFMIQAASQIPSALPKVHGEIGVLFGGSLLMTIHALRAIGSHTCVLGIDPFTGYYGKAHDPMTKLPVTAEQVRQNISLLGFDDHPVQLIAAPSESPEAQHQVHPYRFASLWIDGDHSYEGIKRDWYTYTPLVLPGGYVLIDNYRDGTFPGVDEFIHTDLLPNLAQWDVVANMSRSILLRKRSAPPSFRPYTYAQHRIRSLIPRQAHPASPKTGTASTLYPRRIAMTNFLLQGCQYEATTQAESYIQVLLRSLRSGEHFLDIGSNEGVLALQAALRGVRVAAVESDLTFRSVLHQNILHNQLQPMIRIYAPPRLHHTDTRAADEWKRLLGRHSPYHVVRINYPGAERDILTALHPLLTATHPPRMIALEHQLSSDSAAQTVCNDLLSGYGYEIEHTWHIPATSLCLQIYVPGPWNSNRSRACESG